ncbi:hypothetical protein QAD02_010098 [Eretmocerus hayati]|uniref:Uncharacterized protein n=1 Tax=Eretmocerus hayati TaxID=131215 RepID=A0ACC2NBB6_9HYME|nr:hypothetical protein QAD02_010098 [Eretmocerus hayati]
MSPNKLSIIVTIVAILSVCDSYKILAVFPSNVTSHAIFFDALIKGILRAGHQVDHITLFPIKTLSAQYKMIINLYDEPVKQIAGYPSIDFVLRFAKDIEHCIATERGNKACHLMGSKEFQRLVKNPPQDPPYDLVITEVSNCYFGLGDVFNVPVVAVSSSAEFPWIADFTGNADNLAIVPNLFQMNSGPMNFWQRLKNVISNHMSVRRFQSLTAESQTESMTKYLKHDIPDIREVEKNVALFLVNSHPIIFGVKPVTPAFIQVAGLHVEENEDKLSQELEKWMNESTNGIVYFSLGSRVLIESFSPQLLKEIYASFEMIAPVRVLMKIVDKSKLLPGIPENVKVMPWIPQQPVLAHPNVKIFITHGGLLGLLEALKFGVPMIGIPLFSDQFRNVEAFVARGMMLRIYFENLSRETLHASLEALLHDPQFKESAIHHSRLLWDQPLSPMRTAIFWIEYVIRNGGDVLKSPAVQLTWWQLALLDVYGAILMSFFLVFISIFYSITFIMRRLLYKSSEKDCSRESETKIRLKKFL